MSTGRRNMNGPMSVVVGEHEGEEWHVVLVAGRTLVGRDMSARTDADLRLAPIFELTTSLIKEAGQIGVRRKCLPVCLLPSVLGLLVPRATAIVIPFAALSPEDRRQLEAAVEDGNGVAVQMRAHQAGLAASRIVMPGA